MMSINVNIKLLRENAALPAYATDGSAALDLRASLDAPLTIGPGERAKIPTGIAIAPESKDVVAVLCARSGLASKQGVTLVNGIGVIDSDYRGEIAVAVINLGDAPAVIAPGDRVAQLMFMPVLHANLIPVTELDETARGAGGFGSTGVK
ncbi:MAG: dUTP diphosphatase [Clostridia bacterium]|nr:dUTP diphosphatase [Clostridia bacterium]